MFKENPTPTPTRGVVLVAWYFYLFILKYIKIIFFYFLKIIFDIINHVTMI
jgi:hypothetical protein